jgi:hypothetical protein
MSAAGRNPATQEKVNQVVAIAMATNSERIDLKPGPWRCRSVLSGISGTGETIDRAQLAAALHCIQMRCAHMGDDFAQAVKADPDLRSALRAAGADEALIRAMVEKFSDPDTQKGLNQSACTRKGHEGDPYRTVAYDSCFSDAMECFPMEPCR